jgi:hypothetical protein
LGTETASRSSDVYSLALMATRIIRRDAEPVSLPPAGAEQGRASARPIATTALARMLEQDLAGIPQVRVRAVLAKALSIRPSDRHRTAAEFVDEFTAAVDVETRPRLKRTTSTRSMVLLLSCVLCLLSLATAMTFDGLGGKRPGESRPHSAAVAMVRADRTNNQPSLAEGAVVPQNVAGNATAASVTDAIACSVGWLRSGEFDAAANCFSNSTPVGEHPGAAHCVCVAYCQLQMRRIGAAHRFLRESVVQHEDDPMLWFLLGIADQEMAMFEGRTRDETIHGRLENLCRGSEFAALVDQLVLYRPLSDRGDSPEVGASRPLPEYTDDGLLQLYLTRAAENAARPETTAVIVQQVR